jgi:TonB family protein
MTRLMFVAPLLLAAAAVPALAVPASDSKSQAARNWDVMLSQYPARAREAREQGPVGFRVTLDRDGYATECVVTSSSGYPLLDDETCRLILTRGEFKGLSDAGGRKANGVFEGVVNWRLPGAAAAAAPATAPAAPVRTASASLGDKKVCKRQPKTGSLAGYERICATQSQWDRYTQDQRRFWEDQQGTKGSTSGH